MGRLVDLQKTALLESAACSRQVGWTKLRPQLDFAAEGSQILVDHEQTTIAEHDFDSQTDTWYHVMLEIKGAEFLVRFQDGPTLYGNHPGVGLEFENYDIGRTAINKGTFSIDILTACRGRSENLERYRTTACK